MMGVQILICQNLRNNLQHPNEYIRGVTLRFLCRIREEEILEPLIPSILACLEHRHSYVRRNAVLAINALYKLPKGEHLLQDAPELIEKVGALPAAPAHSKDLCTVAVSGRSRVAHSWTSTPQASANSALRCEVGGCGSAAARAAATAAAQAQFMQLFVVASSRTLWLAASGGS